MKAKTDIQRILNPFVFKDTLDVPIHYHLDRIFFGDQPRAIQRIYDVHQALRNSNPLGQALAGIIEKELQLGNLFIIATDAKYLERIDNSFTYGWWDKIERIGYREGLIISNKHFNEKYILLATDVPPELLRRNYVHECAHHWGSLLAPEEYRYYSDPLAHYTPAEQKCLEGIVKHDHYHFDDRALQMKLTPEEASEAKDMLINAANRYANEARPAWKVKVYRSELFAFQMQEAICHPERAQLTPKLSQELYNAIVNSSQQRDLFTTANRINAYIRFSQDKVPLANPKPSPLLTDIINPFKIRTPYDPEATNKIIKQLIQKQEFLQARESFLGKLGKYQVSVDEVKRLWKCSEEAIKQQNLNPSHASPKAASPQGNGSFSSINFKKFLWPGVYALMVAAYTYRETHSTPDDNWHNQSMFNQLIDHVIFAPLLYTCPEAPVLLAASYLYESSRDLQRYCGEQYVHFAQKEHPTQTDKWLADYWENRQVEAGVCRGMMWFAHVAMDVNFVKQIHAGVHEDLNLFRGEMDRFLVSARKVLPNDTERQSFLDDLQIELHSPEANVIRLAIGFGKRFADLGQTFMSAVNNSLNKLRQEFPLISDRTFQDLHRTLPAEEYGFCINALEAAVKSPAADLFRIVNKLTALSISGSQNFCTTAYQSHNAKINFLREMPTTPDRDELLDEIQCDMNGPLGFAFDAASKPIQMACSMAFNSMKKWTADFFISNSNQPRPEIKASSAALVGGAMVGPRPQAPVITRPTIAPFLNQDCKGEKAQEPQAASTLPEKPNRFQFPEFAIKPQDAPETPLDLCNGQVMKPTTNNINKEAGNEQSPTPAPEVNVQLNHIPEQYLNKSLHELLNEHIEKKFEFDYVNFGPTVDGGLGVNAGFKGGSVMSAGISFTAFTNRKGKIEVEFRAQIGVQIPLSPFRGSPDFTNGHREKHPSALETAIYALMFFIQNTKHNKDAKTVRHLNRHIKLSEEDIRKFQDFLNESPEILKTLHLDPKTFEAKIAEAEEKYQKQREEFEHRENYAYNHLRTDHHKHKYLANYYYHGRRKFELDQGWGDLISNLELNKLYSEKSEQFKKTLTEKSSKELLARAHGLLKDENNEKQQILTLDQEIELSVLRDLLIERAIQSGNMDIITNNDFLFKDKWGKCYEFHPIILPEKGIRPRAIDSDIHDRTGKSETCHTRVINLHKLFESFVDLVKNRGTSEQIENAWKVFLDEFKEVRRLLKSIPLEPHVDGYETLYDWDGYHGPLKQMLEIGKAVMKDMQNPESNEARIVHFESTLNFVAQHITKSTPELINLGKMLLCKADKDKRSSHKEGKKQKLSPHEIEGFKFLLDMKLDECLRANDFVQAEDLVDQMIELQNKSDDNENKLINPELKDEVQFLKTNKDQDEKFWGQVLQDSNASERKKGLARFRVSEFTLKDIANLMPQELYDRYQDLNNNKSLPAEMLEIKKAVFKNFAIGTLLALANKDKTKALELLEQYQSSSSLLVDPSIAPEVKKSIEFYAKHKDEPPEFWKNQIKARQKEIKDKKLENTSEDQKRLDYVINHQDKCCFITSLIKKFSSVSTQELRECAQSILGSNQEDPVINACEVQAIEQVVNQKVIDLILKDPTKAKQLIIDFGNIEASDSQGNKIKLFSDVFITAMNQLIESIWHNKENGASLLDLLKDPSKFIANYDKLTAADKEKLRRATVDTNITYARNLSAQGYHGDAVHHLEEASKELSEAEKKDNKVQDSKKSELYQHQRQLIEPNVRTVRDFLEKQLIFFQPSVVKNILDVGLKVDNVLGHYVQSPLSLSLQALVSSLIGERGNFVEQFNKILGQFWKNLQNAPTSLSGMIMLAQLEVHIVEGLKRILPDRIKRTLQQGYHDLTERLPSFLRQGVQFASDNYSKVPQGLKYADLANSGIDIIRFPGSAYVGPHLSKLYKFMLDSLYAHDDQAKRLKCQAPTDQALLMRREVLNMLIDNFANFAHLTSITQMVTKGFALFLAPLKLILDAAILATVGKKLTGLNGLRNAMSNIQVLSNDLAKLRDDVKKEKDDLLRAKKMEQSLTQDLQYQTDLEKNCRRLQGLLQRNFNGLVYNETQVPADINYARILHLYQRVKDAYEKKLYQLVLDLTEQYIFEKDDAKGKVYVRTVNRNYQIPAYQAWLIIQLRLAVFVTSKEHFGNFRYEYNDYITYILQGAPEKWRNENAEAVIRTFKEVVLRALCAYIDEAFQAKDGDKLIYLNKILQEQYLYCHWEELLNDNLKLQLAIFAYQHNYRTQAEAFFNKVDFTKLDLKQICPGSFMSLYDLATNHPAGKHFINSLVTTLTDKQIGDVIAYLVSKRNYQDLDRWIKIVSKDFPQKNYALAMVIYGNSNDEYFGPALQHLVKQKHKDLNYWTLFFRLIETMTSSIMFLENIEQINCYITIHALLRISASAIKDEYYKNNRSLPGNYESELNSVIKDANDRLLDYIKANTKLSQSEQLQVIDQLVNTTASKLSTEPGLNEVIVTLFSDMSFVQHPDSGKRYLPCATSSHDGLYQLFAASKKEVIERLITHLKAQTWQASTPHQKSFYDYMLDYWDAVTKSKCSREASDFAANVQKIVKQLETDKSADKVPLDDVGSSSLLKALSLLYKKNLTVFTATNERQLQQSYSQINNPSFTTICVLYKKQIDNNNKDALKLYSKLHEVTTPTIKRLELNLVGLPRNRAQIQAGRYMKLYEQQRKESPAVEKNEKLTLEALKIAHQNPAPIKWLELGRNYYGDESKEVSFEDLLKARICYKQVIASLPNHSECLYMLGLIAAVSLLAEESNIATDYFKRARKAGQNDARRLLLEMKHEKFTAEEWFARGEHYNNKTNSLPKDKFKAQICYEYAVSKEHKAAKLPLMLLQNPSFTASNWYKKANDEKLLHHYENAKLYYDAALKVEPQHVDSLFASGEYHEQGLGSTGKNFTLAKEYYQKAEKLGHSEAQYRHIVVSLLLEHASNPPKTAQFWFDLGTDVPHHRAFGNTPDYMRARACFEQAISINKDFADALYELGWLHWMHKNLSMGRYYYERAAAQNHFRAKAHLLSVNYPGVKSADEWYALGESYYSGSDYQGKTQIQDFMYAAICYMSALGRYTFHIDSLIKLGRMYEYGLGVPKNLIHARDYFRELAAKNAAYSDWPLRIEIKLENTVDTTSQWFATAEKYYRTKPEPEYKKAKLCYENAINDPQNGAQSLYVIGWMYQHGQGMAKDLKQAVDHYLRASSKNNTLAKQALTNVNESPFNTAKAWYELGQDYGKKSEYILERLCYEQGIRFKSKEIEYGHCLYILGTLFHSYPTLYGVNHDINEAKKYYQQAWENGDYFPALKEFLKLENRGFTTAQQWYKLGCTNGSIERACLEIIIDTYPNHSHSLARLGYFYEHGLSGLSKDKDQAIVHYLRAYLLGSECAKLNLKNYTTTKGWYELGNNFYFGNGKTQDYSLARACYEQATHVYSKENEYVSALFSLGIIFQYGQGIPKDLTKARTYHVQAVQSDLYPSYKELLIIDNNPDKPELTTAQQWCDAAEEYYKRKGYFQARARYEIALSIEKPEHAYSLYSLGWMYAHGEDVAKDITEARKYYRRAAEAGNYHAKSELLLIDNSSINSIQGWFELGEKYYHGRDGKLQDRDYARACYEYALNGTDRIPRNYEQAAECFEEAQAKGSPAAFRYVGLFFEHNFCTNYPLHLYGAAYYYQQAIEKGYDAKEDLERLCNISDISVDNLNAIGRMVCGMDVDRVTVNYEQAEQFFKKAQEKGGVDAIALGWLQEHANKCPQHFVAAAKYYQQAIQKRCKDAQNYLDHLFNRTDISPDDLVRIGDLYHNATDGITRNYEQAAKWYEKAKDSSVAYLNLGRFYEFGHHYPKNFYAAAVYYQLAIQKGYQQAQLDLDRILKRADISDTELNDIGIVFLLGDTGNGVVINYSRAAQFFERANAKGSVNALCNLGFMYAHGHHYPQNFVNAAKFYQQAIERKCINAQEHLNNLFDRTDICTDDLVRIGDLYDAVNQNAIKWGEEIPNGIEGITRNYEKAAKWYEKAKEKGCSVAYLKLGWFYEFGNHYPKNFYAAAVYYQLAIQKDYQQAQLNLDRILKRADISDTELNDIGIVFILGDTENGLVANYPCAAQFFERANAKGSVNALCNLGFMYAHGHHYPQNFVNAAKFYQQAIERKCINAQEHLNNLFDRTDICTDDLVRIGDLYDAVNQNAIKWGEEIPNGIEGITRNYEKAAKWYEKAKEKGCSVAYLKLGWFYEFGNHYPKNFYAAAVYYQLAIQKDYQQAQLNLDRILKRADISDTELNDIGIVFILGDTENGLVANYPCAAQFFERAKEKGSVDALCNLGWMYEHGHHYPQNFVNAAKFYQQGNAQGHLNGLFNRTDISVDILIAIGNMYRDGDGVTRNNEQAVKWYRKAIANECLVNGCPGCPGCREHDPNPAQESYHLGLSYERGKRRDYVKARDCYEQAIKLDPKHAEALYRLGIIFEFRKGVARICDPSEYYKQVITEARTYYERAAKEDHYHAKERLLIINNYSKFNTAKEWNDLGDNYSFGINNTVQDNTFARICYEKSIAMDPNNSDSRQAVAKTPSAQTVVIVKPTSILNNPITASNPQKAPPLQKPRVHVSPVFKTTDVKSEQTNTKTPTTLFFTTRPREIISANGSCRGDATGKRKSDFQYEGNEFILHRVLGNGECAYSAYRIGRNEAHALIQERINADDRRVKEILKPLVQGELFEEGFINYLFETQTAPAAINAFRQYQAAATRRENLEDCVAALKNHAGDREVLLAFIRYDILCPPGERNGNRGWAHLDILIALAHIQDVNLHFWTLDRLGKIVPYQLPLTDYRPTNGTRRMDLLYNGSNHFDRLERIENSSCVSALPVESAVNIALG